MGYYSPTHTSNSQSASPTHIPLLLPRWLLSRPASGRAGHSKRPSKPSNTAKGHDTSPMTWVSKRNDSNLIHTTSILAHTTAGVHVDMTPEHSERPRALVTIWGISILPRSNRTRHARHYITLSSGKGTDIDL